MDEVIKYFDDLIPRAEGQSVILHEKGITQDIIHSILDTHRQDAWQLKALADNVFSGKPLIDQIGLIHGFIRRYIKYVIDPDGQQFIKSPARTWRDKQADCKGFSLFAGAILEALNVPFVYRFVSFDRHNPTPSHVYVVATDPAGTSYVLDACLAQPFQQQNFINKTDIMPTHISKLSGVKMLEGEVLINLERQRLALERDILGKNTVSGIGQTMSDQQFLAEIRSKNEAGVSVAPLARTSAQENFIVDLVNDLLPDASSLFLYLFIKNPATIQALPASIARKRNEAVALAQQILEATGMDDNVFLKIVRVSIMRQTGTTPEQLIYSILAGEGINGIGSILAAVTTLLPAAVKAGKAIGNAVKNLFGKKDTANPEAAAPSSKDGKAASNGAEAAKSAAAAGVFLKEAVTKLDSKTASPGQTTMLNIQQDPLPGVDPPAKGEKKDNTTLLLAGGGVLALLLMNSQSKSRRRR